jgi:hypothetical protein
MELLARILYLTRLLLTAVVLAQVWLLAVMLTVVVVVQVVVQQMLGLLVPQHKEILVEQLDMEIIAAL